MGVSGQQQRNWALGYNFNSAWTFGGGLRGLFSYGTSDRSLTDDYLSATTGQRNELAMYLIHLFPAFREGVLPDMQTMAAGNNTAKIGRAAAQLVSLCEAAVKDDISVSKLLDGGENYVRDAWGGSSILRPRQPAFASGL